MSIFRRHGLGLRFEHHSTRARDHVWMGEVGGLTEWKRISAARKDGAGYDSLEQYAPPQANQRGASWCVGEMLYRMMAITDAVHGLPFEPVSPRAVYRQSVEEHTVPGARLLDEGTYIRVALSAVAKKGCGLLEQWPRKWLTLSGQADLSPVPAPVRSTGFNRRGLRFQFITTLSLADELDACDAAIEMGRPVGFGWAVTERFMAHKGSAPFDARLRKSDVVRGGHAQDQMSKRDASGNIRAGNSWGDGHGDGGPSTIIADTMSRRDIFTIDGYERLAGHAG